MEVLSRGSGKDDMHIDIRKRVVDVIAIICELQALREPDSLHCLDDS